MQNSVASGVSGVLSTARNTLAEEGFWKNNSAVSPPAYRLVPPLRGCGPLSLATQDCVRHGGLVLG
jgi:hypothetical protein